MTCNYTKSNFSLCYRCPVWLDLLLHGNDLSGVIPTEICILSLTNLTADCLGPNAKVTCTCCTQCYWIVTRHPYIFLHITNCNDSTESHMWEKRKQAHWKRIRKKDFSPRAKYLRAGWVIMPISRGNVACYYRHFFYIYIHTYTYTYMDCEQSLSNMCNR